MKGNIKRLLSLALIMMIFMLCSVGAYAEGKSEENGTGTVTVSSVEELLAAVASDTTVKLKPGFYDLSEAGDYGSSKTKNPAYSWNEVYDGWEFVIEGIENFSIEGGGEDETVISAGPRYANVLSFDDCSGVSISNLKAGHSEMPGSCCGGVIMLRNCEGVRIEDCGLYGCGVLGLEAYSSRDIFMQDTDIYDCSYGAVKLDNCANVLINDCSMDRCGTEEACAYTLIEIASSRGVSILNCEIEENVCLRMLDSIYSEDVEMRGCEVEDNKVLSGLFGILHYPVTIGGCEFSYNGVSPFYDPDNYDVKAVTPGGEELNYEDFKTMSHTEAEFELPQWTESGAAGGEKAAEAEEPENTGLPTGARREVHAETVDEFLEAIGPDTTIYLDAELFDLSTASGYGSYGGKYYRWKDIYDGPGLIITDVEGLSIAGQGKDKTTFCAVPRYADVLRFSGCENISLSGISFGHTDLPEENSCCGGVLDFEGAENVRIDGCGLYGCGIVGISAFDSENFTVSSTEIYDCSNGAIHVHDCEDMTFKECDIHDCGENPVFIGSDCENIHIDAGIPSEPEPGPAEKLSNFFKNLFGIGD
ncbi:MAG: right-handed parallel beta-helix repeat-containing protein [Candidatus Limivicinus sp.]